MRRHVLLILAVCAALSPATVPTGSPINPPAVAAQPLPARFTGKIQFVAGVKPSNGASNTIEAFGPTLTSCGKEAVRGDTYGVNVSSGNAIPGCPLSGQPVYFKLGDYWAQERGQWSPGFPISLDLTFPKMTTETIPFGCNAYVLTFSNGTSIETVLANLQPLDPGSTIAAIWFWNAPKAQWQGYFPDSPAALNTLKTVNRLDTVWICVTGPSQLSRPSLTP
ncbi:MAG: hypothetical protein C4290_01350 [Chloroflexota bacterium]